MSATPDELAACRIAGWHSRIGDLRAFLMSAGRDAVPALCRAYREGVTHHALGKPCGCEECVAAKDAAPATVGP